MSNDTTTTVARSLTADPELRVGGSGVPVAHFTVASTSRAQDSSSGGWRDGDTLFLRCSAWRFLAQNAVESLRKGARVVVTERLQQRTCETDDGQKRSALQLVADEVSVSLRHAIVRADPSRARPDAGYGVGAPSERRARGGVMTGTGTWRRRGKPPAVAISAWRHHRVARRPRGRRATRRAAAHVRARGCGSLPWGPVVTNQRSMKAQDLRALPAVVDLLTAAAVLDIGRTVAYELVRTGRWPTPVFRLGGRIKVPTVPLLELLGVSTDPSAAVPATAVKK